MVPQTESPYFHEDSTRAVHQSLKTIFPIVKPYTAFMPIYPSAYWSFAFCSKKYDPLKNFDEARWNKLGLSTRYYNSDIHRGAFALPQWVKKITE
jgi:spermidine synthase